MADRQVGVPPFRGKHQEQAYADGREAFGARRGRDDLPDYAGARRSLATSWQAGWDDAATEARDAAQERREAERARRAPEAPRALHPLAMWPADRPMPTVYRRPPIPCLNCRRLLTDDGGRAVLVRSVSKGLAYFRCRCCGHGGAGRPQFKLPVAE